MRIRACLILLLVFALVWQSDGWWGRRRRRRRSTIGCSGPPALPRDVTQSGCSAPYTHGEKCTHSCRPGYIRLTGNTTRTCSNGAWTGSSLDCWRGCSGPPALPRYVTWSGCIAPYTQWERCTYSCQPGYTQESGDTFSTCSNGAWTGSSLVCRRDPSPVPSYSKCFAGQTRSNVKAFPLYGPLSGTKSSNKPTVNEDTSCDGHPSSSNSAATATFFHGTTQLDIFRRRRDVDDVFIWAPYHRVLLFRGEVFEWGVGADKMAWEGRRCPSDCGVTWAEPAAGNSNCTREQAEFFTREYKSRYGSYTLYWNNCHKFVNRLMKYLDSGCTRMPY